MSQYPLLKTPKDIVNGMIPLDRLPKPWVINGFLLVSWIFIFIYLLKGRLKVKSTGRRVVCC